MKKHIFYSFVLLLLLTATIAKAQEYTNDTLWQASVGGTITDIFFSPDDEYLVVVGYNSDLCPSFFDAKTGELLFRIKESVNSYFGDISSDSKYFISNVDIGNEFIIYDIEKREPFKIIPKIKDRWRVGRFIRNSNRAWITTFESSERNDYKTYIFDTNTWEIIHEMETGHIDLLKSSPDGRYVGYRGSEAIIVRNTETYEIHKIFRMPERINDFAFSPDGTMIAGTSNEELIVWNFNSKDILLKLKEDEVYLYSSICFSKDNRFMVYVWRKFIQGQGLIGGSNAFSLENNKTVHSYPDGGGGGIDITNDNKYIAFANPIVYHAKWGETSVSEIPENENIIYPNPATGIVNILLDIKKAETIDVNIYDISGNIITNIFNGIAEPGTILTWDSSRHPSGTYYCKVESQTYNRSYRVIVCK
jgi:WD40 repeat protein